MSRNIMSDIIEKSSITCRGSMIFGNGCGTCSKCKKEIEKCQQAFLNDKTIIKKFPKWFGKGCEFFSGVWEENEITGGPDYKEYEPVLVHCFHEENHSDFEGNCNEKLCPKLRGENEIY